MYEKACDSMYKMISERFCYKRTKLELTNKEIYPYTSNDNMMSSIANCRCDKRRNKYLVPAPMTEIIASNLKFKSPEAFLWGNEKEIEAYAADLFSLLVHDTFYLFSDIDRKSTGKKNKNSEQYKLAKQIATVLHEYIPFAKADSFEAVSLEYSYAKESLLFYMNDIIDDISQDKYSESLSDATSWFYEKVKDEFIAKLQDFLYSLPSTLKLNKRFFEFSKDTLVPMLEKAVPAYSIGQEWYSILVKDLEYALDFFLPYPKTLDDVEYPDEVTEPIVSYSTDFITGSIEAELTCVDTIARLQIGKKNRRRKRETWNPSMCDT